MSDLDAAPPESADGALLGARIRSRRQELGLTLQAVAERIGVSKSYLGQVETARLAASVGLLERISDVLQVPIRSLVAVGQDSGAASESGSGVPGPADRRAYVTRADRRTGLLPPGGRSPLEILTPDLRRKIEVTQSADPPGAWHAVDRSGVAPEEFVHVLAGRYEIDLGEAVHTLDAGDSMVFYPTATYRVRSSGPGHLGLPAGVLMSGTAGPAPTDDLGRRLRALRTSRGRSIQQVAEAAEVSKSFISHLELGRSSASLGTLKRICAALDAPVWTLLDDPDESVSTAGQVAIVRGAERKSRRVVGTEIDIALLTPDLNRGFQVTMSVLKPGEGYGSETYTHEAEEFGVVLQGAYEVTVDGVVHTLQEGDSIYFDSRLPHRTRAVGAGDTVTFWVTTPPS